MQRFDANRILSTYSSQGQEPQFHPRYLPRPSDMDNNHSIVLPRIGSPNGLLPGPRHQATFVGSLTPGSQQATDLSGNGVLVDNGWVQKFKQHAKDMREMTGQKDPHPEPQRSCSPSYMLCTPAHSVRQPSVASYTPSVSSPARSHSANLDPTGPHGGGFSPIGSFLRPTVSPVPRAKSTDKGQAMVRFEDVHGRRPKNIQWREPDTTSCDLLRHWLRLSKEVQMRILMYVDYKRQIRLKATNAAFWNLIQLDAIPWEERHAVILDEERNNENNFPSKKSSTAADDEDDDEEMSEVDSLSEGEPGSSKKRKISPSNKSRKSGTKRTKGNNKGPNRWGCYFCCNILPASYFEGPCLEETHGHRGPRDNRQHGRSDADRKVAMRVEYVRILDAVPQAMPEWLTHDLRLRPRKSVLDVDNLEACVEERMKQGVNCDDLREHYKDLCRDTHLVAAVRNVQPVYTKAQQHPVARPQTQFPPVYGSLPKQISRRERESAGFSYELSCIPEDALRDEKPAQLPVASAPVSRMCLPPQRAEDGRPCGPETALQSGDMVSLRRACIPCSAELGIIRRDDNRKVTSMTGKGWWPCNCRKVWRAGTGTGCPDCGCPVIF